MSKFASCVALMTAGALTAFNLCVLMRETRKNMLDVLIEEIETIK